MIGLISSSKEITDSSVTWKITIEEELDVAGFTWGVEKVYLNGTSESDDSFKWDYSVNDTGNWQTLVEVENKPASGTGNANITLENQTYTVTSEQLASVVGSTKVTSIYIRASLVEGPTTNDGGAWEVWSKAASGGGISDNSFITLNLATVPEPAASAAVFGALACACCLWHRYRNAR
jgi:hypothetical protein